MIVTDERQPDRVLELVVFTLKDGVTREQLLGTVDAVSAWARSQPGFISRDLSHNAEQDKWIEVVYWASLHDAEAAAKASEGSEQCAPMFALIEMGRRCSCTRLRRSHRCTPDSGPWGRVASRPPAPTSTDRGRSDGRS